MTYLMISFCTSNTTLWRNIMWDSSCCQGQRDPTAQAGTVHALPRRSLLYCVMTMKFNIHLGASLITFSWKASKDVAIPTLHEKTRWCYQVWALCAVAIWCLQGPSDTLQRWKVNITWPPPDGGQCILHLTTYNGEWRAIKSPPGWAPCLSPLTVANQLFYNTLFLLVGLTLASRFHNVWPHLGVAWWGLGGFWESVQHVPVAEDGEEQGHWCGKCLWVSLRSIRVVFLTSCSVCTKPKRKLGSCSKKIFV